MKILLLLLITLVTNCSLTKEIKSFNNLSTPIGKPKYYQVTNNYAIHFFFGIFPITSTSGNAKFEKTLEDFTMEAAKKGNSKVYIIQKETTNLWFILPPLTFIFTPVNTEVIGFVSD